ncbi:MAG: hypothetical protein K2H82_07985 [Oscillospiraceae bacterium]|nr:hypothetical protein [Oscillospiraceae bacterium]
MIRLQVCPQEVKVEMRGSDNVILSELSDAIFRMLEAMEHSGGRPVSENLTILILHLLEMQEVEQKK